MTLIFLFLIHLCPQAQAQTPSFAAHIKPILAAKCAGCHNTMVDYATVRSKYVSVGSPGASPLYKWIEVGRMPPPGKPRVSAEELQLIANWIGGGAAP